MISFGYNRFKFENVGKKCCRIYEYSDGYLIRSWFVYAHYDGGHIPTFIEMNKSIEQFCLDFSMLEYDYPIFNL